MKKDIMEKENGGRPECGCRLHYGKQEFLNLKFCPLHESARELLKACKWGTNLLKRFAEKEAKEKHTTYKMCEYSALKAMIKAIAKATPKN